MRVELLPLDASRYEPHGMHASDRVWTETNCYVDLWVEVLHALGHEPAAAGAFALASDFVGDQWTFFKHPAEDLRALYGIEVAELTVWRPLREHVVEYLGLGCLLTVEVDAWHLPDTAGVSYRRDHVKTTIVPQMIDTGRQQLGYFHNSGYHELCGDDFVALLAAAEGGLPPYVELVRRPPDDPRPLAAVAPAPAQLVTTARQLAVRHLARRPATNPVHRFAVRLQSDLEWLAGGGLEPFHRYAFATCRQCGAAAEVAAAFVDWLAGEEAALAGRATVPPAAAGDASQALRDLAGAAKALQFTLARAAAGRPVDVGPLVEAMAAAWERAGDALGARHGG